MKPDLQLSVSAVRGLSTGSEASPSSTPWTQAKNTTSPTPIVAVVTEKASDTPSQRPDPTTWNQHPPDKSLGPLGVVGDEEKCWNYLAGVYSEQGRCGDQPSCCFQSGQTRLVNVMYDRPRAN